MNFYPHDPKGYIPGITSNDAGCFDASFNFAPDYVANAPSFNNLSSVIAKIDHSFNPKNNISGRYFFGDSTQQFPLALNASGGELPGFDTVTPTRVQLVSISLRQRALPDQGERIPLRLESFRRRFLPAGSKL